MADESSTSPQQGGRTGGNREPGGFRIRLSDNEMRAARALQDAFRLRSTVAVLGFSVRALAQMLEEGKLDELMAQQRSQGGDRPPRGGSRSPRPGDGERAPVRSAGAARVNPFARPARPSAAQQQPEDSASLASGEQGTEASPGEMETGAAPDVAFASTAEASGPEAMAGGAGDAAEASPAASVAES